MVRNRIDDKAFDRYLAQAAQERPDAKFVVHGTENTNRVNNLKARIRKAGFEVARYCGNLQY